MPDARDHHSSSAKTMLSITSNSHCHGSSAKTSTRVLKKHTHAFASSLSTALLGCLHLQHRFGLCFGSFTRGSSSSFSGMPPQSQPSSRAFRSNSVNNTASRTAFCSRNSSRMSTCLRTSRRSSIFPCPKSCSCSGVAPKRNFSNVCIAISVVVMTLAADILAAVLYS